MKSPAAGSGRSASVIQTVFFLLIATGMVGTINLFVPSLSLASHNILYRLRGAYKPSDQIVILAIDDASLQRIGPWPWSRSVMAKVIDRVTSGKPRAIGLDLIYAEPADPAGDQLLANSLAASGRVVLPVQLYQTDQSLTGATIEWLAPTPLFKRAAAALGHVHVSPGIDGMIRSVQLSKADDLAQRHWAFGLEVLRLADGTASEEIRELPGWLEIGTHRIPVTTENRVALPGVDQILPHDMLINFAGATGSFLTLSIAGLLDGKVRTERFRDRIVLIGATAQSMGDTRVAPFTHYGQDAVQGGQQMAGVEIHANIINTIRSRVFFRSFPEWFAILISLGVMLLATGTVILLDGWRQVLTLSGLLMTILVGSYLTFSTYRFLPPLVQMLTAYGVIIPLLISRSLSVSRELDLKLAALAEHHRDLLPESATGLPDLMTYYGREEGARPAGLPHSLDWKLRTVDSLTSRILARMSFVNRILSSMEEGVLVTDLDGQIVFANRKAEQLLAVSETSLSGQRLVDWLERSGKVDSRGLHTAITTALDHQQAQVDFTFPSPNPRYYALSFSALVANSGSSDAEVSPLSGNFMGEEVIGVVVLVSDISKRVELDRMKTETLQLVSHELRNPLNSIQGLSDVLLTFSVDREQSQELVATINLESRRLGETINRYLDLTRIESGARSITVTSIDARQLIEGSLRQHAIAAAQKGIRLVEQIDPQLPRLLLDANLMDHALSNLIGNAIKYSPSGTTVKVIAGRTSEGIVIRVCDEGYGIPEEFRERVFDKFYRLERDNTSEVVGTGLGLTIVREIVERHGGRISIESGLSGGTEFKVFIPLTVPRRYTLT